MPTLDYFQEVEITDAAGTAKKCKIMGFSVNTEDKTALREVKLYLVDGGSGATKVKRDGVYVFDHSFGPTDSFTVPSRSTILQLFQTLRS